MEHVQKIPLTINIRSQIFGDGNSCFANQLLKLGNGTIATHETQIL